MWSAQTALLQTECVIPVIKTLPQVVAPESGSIKKNAHHICILLLRPTPAAMWMGRLSDVEQLACQNKAVLMAPGVDENYMILQWTQ